MRFGPDDTQRMLAEHLDRLLASEVPLQRVREAVGEPDIPRSGQPAAAAVEDIVAQAGLDGMLVPESLGGQGLGVLDAVLLQEVLGRHVTPSWRAFGATLTALALRDEKTGDAQAWLRAIAGGECRVAVALNELAGGREGAGLEAADGRLIGKTLFVVGLAGATHVLTSANGTFALVPLDDSGVSARPLRTIDRTRPMHEVVMSGARPVWSAAATDPSPVLPAARLLVAADALGAAQAMLDAAVAYAGERRQFGRVIGSFQAVKHLCAEMASRLEPCRSLLWYAAYSLDTGAKDAPLMSVLAKSHLTEAATFVARSATEVHGGMGFTDLLGLHYWFKRIGAARQLLGGPVRLREEAARLQDWV